MHRFHIPAHRCQGARLVLAEAESHHATRVLRVAEGDEVEVLDGAGRALRSLVKTARKSEVVLEVLSQRTSPRPAFQVTLAAGVPKGQLFDDMVEQAVELGVTRILPLVTERGNVRFDPDSGRAKQQKWQVIAVEAIKQCGSLWLPEVLQPISFRPALDRIRSGSLSIFGSLHPGAVDPGAALEEGRAAALAGGVTVWLGPEGDFTPAEVEQLAARGARGVTLGPLVLRCPTASVALLSVVTQQLRRWTRPPSA